MSKRAPNSERQEIASQREAIAQLTVENSSKEALIAARAVEPMRAATTVTLLVPLDLTPQTP